jgi:hypothetical protein
VWRAVEGCVTASADRARRYRERLKRGVVVAIAEVPGSLVQTLVRNSLLPAADVDDGRKVGEALVEYIHRNDRHA